MNGPIRKEYPTPAIENGTFDAGTSHGKLLNLLRRGQRVLEFGCASGYMSRAMSEMGCRVIAIEIDPAAAAEARAYCEEVIVADLDVRPLVDLLPATRFDVAVFGDVLEHLRDPWRVLDDTRSFLAPDGYVAISIPNVAHGAVRLALLNGSFDYADVGLLDNTHLRFFTLKSVKELCIRSGYAIEEIDRTKVPMFVDTDVVPRVAAESVEPALLRQIVADPEHDTLQFIVRARPLSDDQRMSELFNQYHETQLKLEEAQKQVALLQGRLDELAEQQVREEEDEMLLLEYARRVEELNLKNAELEDALKDSGSATELEDARAAISALESELAEARRQAEELANRPPARLEEDELLIVDFSRQVEELNLRIVELETATAGIDALERELAEARGRAVELENRPPVRLEEDELLLADFGRQVEELSTRSGELEAELLEQRGRVAELEALERELGETKSKLSELAASKEAAFAAAEELREQLAESIGRIELLELERDGLDLQRDTLEARAAEFEARAAEFETRAAELEAEAAGHESALEAARLAAESAEKRLSAVRELSRAAADDAAELAAKYQESEFERKRLERNAAEMQAELAARNRELGERVDAGSVAREAELRKQLEERRRQIARLEAELAAGERSRPSEEEAEAAQLRERARAMETELKLLVGMFVQHAEAELNRLRHESASIDSAIRATRASAFWGIKALANRAISAPKRLLRRKKTGS